MISSHQREEEFRKDLKFLLEKYDASIFLDSRGEYISYQVIQIELNSKWDGVTNNTTHEYTLFDL